MVYSKEIVSFLADLSGHSQKVRSVKLFDSPFKECRADENIDIEYVVEPFSGFINNKESSAPHFKVNLQFFERSSKEKCVF